MWKNEFNVGRKLYARSSNAFLNDAIPLTISNSVRKCCIHRFPSMDVLHERTTVSKDIITSGTGFSVGHNSNSLSTICTERNKDRENFLRGSNQVEDDFLKKLGKSSSCYIQNMVRRNYATKVNSTSRDSSCGSFLEKDPKLTKSVENLLMRQGENTPRANTEQLTKDKIPNAVFHTNKKLQPDPSHEQVDWLKKVEIVMGDLKRMARKVGKKEGKVTRKPHERHRIYSLIEEAHWVDKAVAAHKRQFPVAKVSFRGNSPKQIKTNDCHNQFAYSNANIPPTNGGSSKFDPPRTAAPNISKPTSSGATTIRSNNNITDAPNIELRMSPSQNESVVSVNVNSFTTADISRPGSSGKEFSVTIRTNRTKAESRTHSLGTITGTPAKTVNASSGNVSSTHNTMQISISEESVPMNQIKFAINGRPLAELKSLQGKADQLNVVTAGDKVEIKVPLNRTNVEDSSDRKSSADSNPVLNLKISAKLDALEPRQTQFNTPSGVNVTNNKSSQGVTKTSSDVIDSGKSTINYGTRNIHRTRVDDEYAHQSTPALGGNGEIPLSKQSFTSSTRQKEELTRTIDNHGPNKDKRVPSNMIPWWSSEDAFSKIKKKEKNNIQSKTRASFDVSGRKSAKGKQDDTELIRRRVFLETIKPRGATQGESLKTSITSVGGLKGVVANNIPAENTTNNGKSKVDLTFEIVANRDAKNSGEVRQFGRTGKSDWRISHPVKKKLERTEKISSNSINVTERKLDCDTIQMREQVENRFSVNRRVSTESGKKDFELNTTVNTSNSKNDVININDSKFQKSENKNFTPIRNINVSHSKSENNSRIHYDANPSSKILSENDKIISKAIYNKTASVAASNPRAQIMQKEYQTEFNEKRIRKTSNKENFARNDYKLTSLLPGSVNKNSSTTDSETGMKTDTKQITKHSLKQSPIIDKSNIKSSNYKKNLNISGMINKSTEKIGTDGLAKPSSTASIVGNKFEKRMEETQPSSPEHPKTSSLKATTNQKVYNKSSFSFPNLKNLSKALSNAKVETAEGNFRSRSVSPTDIKKISSIDMPPLAGTVNPPPRKEFNSKQLVETKVQLTDANVTGKAPLAGTVIPVAKEVKPATNKTDNPKRNT